MKAELHIVCAHLVGSLLNGVYQGVLLWLPMVLLSRCWARANAATRHAVWFSLLLMVALLIPAHYWLDAPPAQPPAAAPAPRATPAGGAANEPAPLALSEAEAGPELGPVLAADPFGVDQTDCPWSDLFPPAPKVEPDLGAEAGVTGRIVSDVAKRGSRGLPAWLETVRSLGAKCLRPISWSPESTLGFGTVMSLSLLWFVIAASRLIVVVCRLFQLKSLVSRASALEHPGLRALFQNLLAQQNVRRPVQLRITSEQRSAVFVGLPRPAILVPQETVNDLAEAGHVLRHELAHLQRYDDWTNLVQHLVQAVLFFHPAILWMGRRLALEREIACDDQVLQWGGRRRHYAMILANVATRAQQRTPLLAPGVSHSHSQLQQRISMILNTRRNSSPKLAKAALASAVSLAGLAAAFVAYSAPRLVLAAPSAGPTPMLLSGTAPGAPALLAAASPEASGAPGEPAPEPGAPSVAAAGIEPGPKFKPEPPATETPEVVEAAPGQPPEPSANIDVAPRAPTPPRMPRKVKPARNFQADSLDGMENGNASMEERLQRLEKMVRSLMDQPNPKRTRGSLVFKDGKDGGNQNWNSDQEQSDKLQDLSERQSARALEQAQRAVEQANRARKDSAARRDEQSLDKGEVRDALRKQLDALRQAREGLNREMEHLDRQIQKLQQEQEHGEKDGSRRRGSAAGDRIHADVSVVPEIAITSDAAK